MNACCYLSHLAFVCFVKICYITNTSLSLISILPVEYDYKNEFHMMLTKFNQNSDMLKMSKYTLHEITSNR